MSTVGLRIKSIMPVANPNEVVISVPIVDGGEAYLTVPKDFIVNNTLHVDHVRSTPEGVLVELPVETSFGSWRLWIAPEHILPVETQSSPSEPQVQVQPQVAPESPPPFPAQTSFSDLVELCHKESVRGGWWSDFNAAIEWLENIAAGRHSPMDRDMAKSTQELLQLFSVGTKIALIHSEVSEALEAYRKNKSDDHLPEYDGLSVELADVFIRMADLMGYLNRASKWLRIIYAKIAYNRKRTDHKSAARKSASGKKF